ncbi:FlgD immunoglobulin-like domain containing protein, partial [Candidatus Eisenbacteria bacterium]
AITPGDSGRIEFTYFNDTEPDYDYTHIYVLCHDDSAGSTEEVEVHRFSGVIGGHDDPQTWDQTVHEADLPGGTDTIQFEIRMVADAGWSDEDGLYETACGPFAADDITITVGGSPVTYDFESGPQGWTFDKCQGVGSYMAVWPEETWSDWVSEVMDVSVCGCPMTENVLGFVDPESPSPIPGHPSGHHEYGKSGIVDSGSHSHYNSTVVRWNAYYNLPYDAGTVFRLGYSYYPFSSDRNPTPGWSPRMGWRSYMYTGNIPYCSKPEPGDVSYFANLSEPSGLGGDPIPSHWEQMRLYFEVYCSCEEFGVPASVCLEGENCGAPLLDNVQVGLTTPELDAPRIALEAGHLFMDSFGQHTSRFLGPRANDTGMSNISRKLRNYCHLDTAVVVGPPVSEPDNPPWRCELCFKVVRKGALQDEVFGYEVWRERFRDYPDYPDVEFVCARMDSAEDSQHVFNNKFATYFHEEDWAFDFAEDDYTEEQEIFPDEVFTPGTRIEYYYRAYWEDYPPYEATQLGPWEFEILPNMQGLPLAQEWPSILYVDAYNRGAEEHIVAVLDSLGLDYDKFDYLDASACYHLPLAWLGTEPCPDGTSGNNGMSLAQSLGYRLLLINTGSFGIGAMEMEDFILFEAWVDSACGDPERRRGIIFNGDQIARIMSDPEAGLAYASFVDTLGFMYDPNSPYREWNNDDEYCVYLEDAEQPEFAPDDSVGLYGNYCPNIYSYGVLQKNPEIAGVTGNLRYWSYKGTGDEEYVSFAEIVREKYVPDTTNWRSVVDGFSLHHLSERDWNPHDCSTDSAAITAGAADLLIPMLAWVQDPADPFVRWHCQTIPDVGVDDENDSPMSGPTNHLYPCRPNPLRDAATIRFSLATPGQVKLDIFDVSGRLVNTLVGDEMQAGENTLIWDGSDSGGRHVGSGLFWVRMRIGESFISSRRMLVFK